MSNNNIIPFQNRVPLPQRTAQEVGKLRKMINSVAQNVVTQNKRPPTSQEDVNIQQVMTASKTYSMRTVDILRIGNNAIPPEYTATAEEAYEDLIDYLDYFRSYSSLPDEIGFTEKDGMFVENYNFFTGWLRRNETRIMQDAFLYNILTEFDKNIMPNILHKLIQKLGIQDDIYPGDDPWERVFYELHLHSIQKKAV